MKHLTVLALVALQISSVQAADLTFGVVDMAKAFAEFHKTKDAAKDFKTNVDKAQKEMNERWDVYKSVLGEMQQMKKEMQDPITTQQEKAKVAADFENKTKELRSLEQEITEAQNRRQNQLKQEDMQIRKGIYDEIIVLVKDKASKDGYDFVFDKSGLSLSTVPVLLYYKDAVDFTDEVIVELNKNAGAATEASAEEAPAASPAEEAASE